MAIRNWILESESRESMRQMFDVLFKSHAEKLKKHSLTSEEIKQWRPDIYQQLQQAVKAMDKSWLNEDLEGFKDAMNRVESLYFTALQEIPEGKR
jgi:hypothetical protein